MGKRKDRSIPITPEIRELLLRQRKRFIEKFGREPGEHDPIFFDPTADQPQLVNDEVVDQLSLEAMRKAKVPPEIIHAYQKTGRLVTPDNARYLSKQDLERWQEAIEEWHRLHDASRNESPGPGGV